MYADILRDVMHVLPMIKTFAANCTTEFFGLPAWYKYLKINDQCEVIFYSGPNGTSANAPEFFGTFVLIALAIVDLLLRVGGLVAVAFVIYGGIQYVTSQGEPDKTAKARGTIINALIGMAICVIAVALVSFVGKRLGG